MSDFKIELHDERNDELLKLDIEMLCYEEYEFTATLDDVYFEIPECLLEEAKGKIEALADNYVKECNDENMVTEAIH